MKRSRLLISVALGLFASGLLAQSTPVVDIYPGSPGSSPDWGTPLWNRLVVEANNGQSGPSPCIVSPRQQSATLLLSRQGGGHAMWLCRIGNEVLYESDYDQASGSELWITDGTKTGTRLLKDINPGPASSSPHWMTRWRDRVFFRADDGIHGAELWVTDGTAAGTRMLRDINPGGVLGSDSDPGGFTVMGDRIFFSANDGVHGLELWASDGTSAGTKMIVDLSPGFTFSAPRDLEAHDGKLYFVAMNFSTGTELYVSDGTAAGTLLLKDIYPGSGSSGVSNLTSWNGRLWFSAMDSDTRGRELWASDGTNAGTRLFMDIRPELFASGDPRCFSPVGSRYLYFSATDGTKGHELWRTDGTVAGTKMVDEILKGPAGSSPSMRSEGSESRFPVIWGDLFFAADDGVVGRELFKFANGATATSVGEGYAPMTRMPPTLNSTDPLIGGRVKVSGSISSGAGSVAITLAGVPADPPLKLPKLDAYSYVDLFSIWFPLASTVPSTSSYTFQIPIPNDPGLKGMRLTLQSWILGTDSKTGFDLSNAVQWWIGN